MISAVSCVRIPDLLVCSVVNPVSTILRLFNLFFGVIGMPFISLIMEHIQVEGYILQFIISHFFQN